MIIEDVMYLLPRVSRLDVETRSYKNNLAISPRKYGRWQRVVDNEQESHRHETTAEDEILCIRNIRRVLWPVVQKCLACTT